MNYQIPFPGNLTYHISDSFLTGYSLGTIYYIIKGIYITPKNYKIKGTIKYIKNRAKKLGGNFALWSLFYSLSFNGICKLRKKNDILNNAFAGFSTGFIMNFRNGFKYSFRSGLTSSFFLLFIEGIGNFHQNYQRKKQINDDNQLIKYYKDEFEKKGIQFL